MKLRNFSYLMLLVVAVSSAAQARMKHAKDEMSDSSMMSMSGPKSKTVTIKNNTKYTLPKVRVVFGFKADSNTLRPHAHEILGSVTQENIKPGESMTFSSNDAVFGQGRKKARYVMPNLKGLQSVCLREINQGSLHKTFHAKKAKHGKKYKKEKGNKMMTRQQHNFVINRTNRHNVIEKASK